jgi:hypothetical protein
MHRPCHLLLSYFRWANCGVLCFRGEESRGAISFVWLTLLLGLLEYVHKDFDEASTMPSVTELFSMGQLWSTMF